MTSMAEQQDMGYSWFMVDDDTLEDGEITVYEPEMTAAPTAFIQRLRSMVSTWKSLGLTDRRTSAAYANGRVWIGVSVLDRDGQMDLGALRVDVSDDEWVANWVTADPLLTNFADSQPFNNDHAGGPVTSVEQGVSEAVGWLEEQLSRPIVRRVWRQNGQVVARSWRFEDTGDTFIASGDAGFWQKPNTATEVVRVRP